MKKRIALYGLLLSLLVAAVVHDRVFKEVPKETANPMLSIVRIDMLFSSGSGTIVACHQDESGFFTVKILTAAHLFPKPLGKRTAMTVQFFFKEGGPVGYKGSIVELYHKEDIALVQVRRMTHSVPVIKMPNMETFYEDLKPDVEVTVIGCSSASKPHIRHGYLNWADGHHTEYYKKTGRYETLSYTAASFYGDSGGALLNANGELIGVISHGTMERIGFSYVLDQHMNFAIPLSIVIEVMRGM